MQLTFTDSSPSCAYLPDRESTTEYEIAPMISPAAYESRMNAGWRKFGMVLFHPVCAHCSACRPIRVRAGMFRPDRSQTRALKRNADLRVEIGVAKVDVARISLYRRYHAGQAARMGWTSEEIDGAGYRMQFLSALIPPTEIAAWDGEELCAVALMDITPNAVSGIYHYYDPARRDRSLGTFAILQTLEYARRLGKPYAYLGYYVAGCASMAYK